ncbi:TIGR03905 family TSCPD domain-containing protein [Alkaliphilus crotonatoxidans]
MYSYTTTAVCSKKITFHIDQNRVKNVVFHGGCPGNLLALTRLIENMEVDEAIEKLRGIPCGNKDTSCADQLSKALEETVKLKKVDGI